MKALSTAIAAAGLVLAAAAVNAQDGTKPFCLTSSSGGGVAKCSYDTMAQCQKAMQPGDNCAPRKSTGDGTGPKKK
jgi:hypothetical protein